MAEDIAVLIIFIIFSIPLIAIAIWGILNPEDVLRNEARKIAKNYDVNLKEDAIKRVKVGYTCLLISIIITILLYIVSIIL